MKFKVGDEVIITDATIYSPEHVQIGSIATIDIIENNYVRLVFSHTKDGTIVQSTSLINKDFVKNNKLSRVLK